MYSPALPDTYATPIPHTQAGTLKDGTSQPVASAKNTAEIGFTSKPPAGDSVSISPEAREAAKHIAQDASPPAPTVQETPPAKEPSYSPVKTVTTSDGTEVSIEASYANDKNGHRQATSVRVNFTGKDGETYSHTLNESSILTQDENGRWNVRQAGSNITGTENDDVIILLPSDRPLHGVTENGVVLRVFSENDSMMNTIDAGEGNNVVIDLSGETTRITTGSGNDTIIGSHRKTGRYVVDSGAGNDTIELTGHASYVYAGDGDDNLLLVSGSVKKIDAGAGDDHIKFKGAGIGISHFTDEEGVIDAGDGDDYLEFGNGVDGTVLGGEGNDTIKFKADGGEGYIDGGAGNDVIRGTGTGGKVSISGGEGDDIIDMDDSSATAHISGGSGSDSVHITSTGGIFNVQGDSGNDYIEYSSSGGLSNIDGGTGNDIIKAAKTGGILTITGGLGDDVIYAQMQGGYMSTLGGGGHDTIIQGNSNTKMTREQLEKISKYHKQSQRIQKEKSDYDQQIFEAAMGLTKKESVLTQEGSTVLTPSSAETSSDIGRQEEIRLHKVY